MGLWGNVSKTEEWYDKNGAHLEMKETRAMSSESIYITDYDMERLRKLLQLEKIFNPDREDLQGLEAELSRAQVVASREIPQDIVMMNSKVRFIDLDTGEEMTYTLVFPEEANIDQNRISVLAPIGTALLGYRVGDTLEWKVPAGLRRLKVTEILYQPEAAGNLGIQS
jgi:regulator of nucleoside diphosphate kinase